MQQQKSLYEVTKFYKEENLAFVPRLNESMPLSIFSLVNEKIKLSFSRNIPRWRFCTTYQEGLCSLTDFLIQTNRNLPKSYLEEGNRAAQIFIETETIQSSKDINCYYLVLSCNCIIYLNDVMCEFDFDWIKIEKERVTINLGEVKSGSKTMTSQNCLERKKDKLIPEFNLHKKIKMENKIIGSTKKSAIFQIILSDK
eukprot:gene12234-5820_t